MSQDNVADSTAGRADREEVRTRLVPLLSELMDLESHLMTTSSDHRGDLIFADYNAGTCATMIIKIDKLLKTYELNGPVSEVESDLVKRSVDKLNYMASDYGKSGIFEYTLVREKKKRQKMKKDVKMDLDRFLSILEGKMDIMPEDIRMYRELKERGVEGEFYMGKPKTSAPNRSQEHQNYDTMPKEVDKVLLYRVANGIRKLRQYPNESFYASDLKDIFTKKTYDSLINMNIGDDTKMMLERLKEEIDILDNRKEIYQSDTMCQKLDFVASNLESWAKP